MKYIRMYVIDESSLTEPRSKNNLSAATAH